MNKTLISLAFTAVAVVAAPAQAVTITQWNFNSATPDAVTGTGTLLPNIGAGLASTLSVSATFSSGDASGGSSDPATGDDSAWQTTNYTAQGVGSKTRGVQFNVSTVGLEDIKFSYDLRHSNTSSRYEQVQYTLDGATFVDAAMFDANLGGDKWYARSVDLSAISGASNNASFGLRVVSVFAPSSSVFAPTKVDSSYGSAGTWRFDMATVSGTVISAVPEPESYALMLAGLAAMGVLARRRRNA